MRRVLIAALALAPAMAGAHSLPLLSYPSGETLPAPCPTGSKDVNCFRFPLWYSFDVRMPLLLQFPTGTNLVRIPCPGGSNGVCYTTKEPSP
jgi:hypothetical protein